MCYFELGMRCLLNSGFIMQSHHAALRAGTTEYCGLAWAFVTNFPVHDYVSIAWHDEFEIGRVQYDWSGKQKQTSTTPSGILAELFPLVTIMLSSHIWYTIHLRACTTMKNIVLLSLLLPQERRMIRVHDYLLAPSIHTSGLLECQGNGIVG